MGGMVFGDYLAMRCYRFICVFRLSYRAIRRQP